LSDHDPNIDPTTGEPLLRVKQKLSTSMKKRSKLMQSSDYAPAGEQPPAEPAPAPEPPAAAPPVSPLVDQPLRSKRIKRTGHFELKPNPFVQQDDAPAEETEY
jgi:hypothetical protein